ncbi:MAG: type II toxin-antitoxin system YafQ family toxin [Chitinivibrionia bacterium]|nr:type II toxin-antitoxin system YafQ family toxin [Chitinivibrionia bacterium]
MLRIRYTKKMKQGMARAIKRGKNINELNFVLNTLAAGKPLPRKYLDHKLTGNKAGFRECHIEPDWLLVYRVQKEELILLAVAIGTHRETLGVE